MVFEKLYILPVMVLIVILYLSYNSSEISNNKLLSYLENAPTQFLPTDAIKGNHIVNYGGVVTNIDLLYKFQEDCKSNITSQLIYTFYNENDEPTIKTAFYKNREIFVNIDDTRTSNVNKDLKSYKFNNFKIIDTENMLQLIFSDNNNEVSFFNYNKKTGEGN